jgi:acylphosphatase
LVARLLREQEVAGSNPVAPTICFFTPDRGAGTALIRAICEVGGQPEAVFVEAMRAARPTSAAEILVEGRVQGVSYRNFVQRKAAQLGLAGYVMNLKDGKVRVRVEGVRETIEELVRDLAKGPPLARVENVAVTWRPPTGRFTTFVIRYAEFDP